MNRLQSIRGIYHEWEHGNYRAGLDLIAPSVHFEVHVPIPEANVYAGVDGMQRYMREFLDSWTDYEIHGRSFEEVGTSVVVHVSHRGRAGGAAVEAQFFTTWTFEGERVVRIDVSQDRDTGVAAASA